MADIRLDIDVQFTADPDEGMALAQKIRDAAMAAVPTDVYYRILITVEGLTTSVTRNH